jgi:hypothetical protein
LAQPSEKTVVLICENTHHLTESIPNLAANIHALNQQAVCEYRLVVESILCSRSQDKCHIERTLDGLLDFCGHEPALHLYRRLCRHYWSIDPSSAAFHVEAYRKIWDSEEDDIEQDRDTERTDCS